MKINDLLKIYTIVGIVFLSVIIASVLVTVTMERPIVTTQQTLPIQNTVCLADNEDVSYEIEKKENEVSKVYITISDKNTNQKKYTLNKELPVPGHYHPLEIHKCGIYMTRSFNYDYKNKKALPNYRMELWKYGYDNKSELIVLLDENIIGQTNIYKYYFGLDFRVSFNEKYIVLIKSYLGQSDYSIVIKDLNSKKDMFTLLASDIIKTNPNLIGSFGMNKWSEDSRYFWGDIFEGAYVNGYYKIDTQNWIYDLYEAPDGAMGGSELNINTGWLPIQPGQIWTGDYQLDQDLKERYRKEGKKSELYLYNLFTKEKILIETTDESIYWFKPKWISDTELQYEMPTGEKKVYIFVKN